VTLAAFDRAACFMRTSRRNASDTHRLVSSPMHGQSWDSPHRVVVDRAGNRPVVSGTLQAVEPGSVVISSAHVHELRALLIEVRKQQYTPASRGHNSNAAVELAGAVVPLKDPDQARQVDPPM